MHFRPGIISRLAASASEMAAFSTSSQPLYAFPVRRLGFLGLLDRVGALSVEDDVGIGKQDAAHHLAEVPLDFGGHVGLRRRGGRRGRLARRLCPTGNRRAAEQRNHDSEKSHTSSHEHRRARPKRPAVKCSADYRFPGLSTQFSASRQFAIAAGIQPEILPCLRRSLHNGPSNCLRRILCVVRCCSRPDSSWGWQCMWRWRRTPAAVS